MTSLPVTKTGLFKDLKHNPTWNQTLVDTDDEQNPQATSLSLMDNARPQDTGQRLSLVSRLGKLSTVLLASSFAVCLGCLAYLE